MDEAFGRLEDISVEQTLQRLESLFESTGGHFPQVTKLQGYETMVSYATPWRLWRESSILNFFTEP